MNTEERDARVAEALKTTGRVERAIARATGLSRGQVKRALACLDRVRTGSGAGGGPGSGPGPERCHPEYEEYDNDDETSCNSPEIKDSSRPRRTTRSLDGGLGGPGSGPVPADLVERAAALGYTLVPTVLVEALCLTPTRSLAASAATSESPTTPTAPASAASLSALPEPVVPAIASGSSESPAATTPSGATRSREGLWRPEGAEKKRLKQMTDALLKQFPLDGKDGCDDVLCWGLADVQAGLHNVIRRIVEGKPIRKNAAALFWAGVKKEPTKDAAGRVKPFSFAEGSLATPRALAEEIVRKGEVKRLVVAAPWWRWFFSTEGLAEIGVGLPERAQLAREREDDERPERPVPREERGGGPALLTARGLVPMRRAYG